MKIDCGHVTHHQSRVQECELLLSLFQSGSPCPNGDLYPCRSSAKKSSGQEKWKQMKDLQLLHFWCQQLENKKGEKNREKKQIAFCQGFLERVLSGVLQIISNWRWCERQRDKQIPSSCETFPYHGCFFLSLHTLFSFL